jgi:fructose-bisphosphate aldolase, class II
MDTLQIFKKAQKDKYAIGQFNISTDEQIRAIVEIAMELKSPIIIATSESERKFIGVKQAVALVDSWRKETELPIILNADHCKSIESVKEAVDAGYDMVQFDGSSLSFEENVKTTKRVLQYAKSKNQDIVVEAELGYLRGGSEIHKEKIEIKEEDLTKPEEAKKFVEATGIDALAVVIGNLHGIQAESKKLFLKRLEEIQESVQGTLLVLHGGSDTQEKDIKGAIKLGIVKININTELRVAYSKALEKEIKEHPEEVKPYKILAPTIEETKKVVAKKIELFGSKEKA